MYTERLFCRVTLVRRSVEYCVYFFFVFRHFLLHRRSKKPFELPATIIAFIFPHDQVSAFDFHTTTVILGLKNSFGCFSNHPLVFIVFVYGISRPRATTVKSFRKKFCDFLDFKIKCQG